MELDLYLSNLLGDKKRDQRSYLLTCCYDYSGGQYSAKMCLTLCLRLPAFCHRLKTFSHRRVSVGNEAARVCTLLLAKFDSFYPVA